MMDKNTINNVLLGKPIYFTDKAPVLGKNGELTLCSPAKCLVCGYVLAYNLGDTIRCKACGSITPSPKRLEKTQ